LPNTRLLAAGVLWSLRYGGCFTCLAFLGLVAVAAAAFTGAALAGRLAGVLGCVERTVDKDLFSFAGGTSRALGPRPRLVEIGRSASLE